MILLVRQRARAWNPWSIVGLAIALLVLLASVSPSTSLKPRKPRRRPPTLRALPAAHQQQPSGRLGPVIVRVIHKHNEPSNCTAGVCKNARGKLDLEALSEQENFLPSDQESLRYVVYPKKYEHFVSKKNTGHGGRYRRYVVLPESIDLSNASEHMASAEFARIPQRNDSKGKPLKKVTLLKATPKRIWLKEPASRKLTGRSRRSLEGGDSSRRNASDYYAQRKAVMERYYARQREINARYANRTSNATLFRLGFERANGSASARNNPPLLRRPLVRINPLHGNETHGKRTDEEPRNTNGERNPLNFHVTPASCVNVSLSGSLAPKTLRHVKNCTQVASDDHRTAKVPTNESRTEGAEQTWGACGNGKLVYQHNLLLGLTGLPSHLDSLFEVFIEDSICITCVQAVPYNRTRAMVSLESGGRGYDYVKLKLRGFKNEGFSYVIKIWAIDKLSRHCNE